MDRDSIRRRVVADPAQPGRQGGRLDKESQERPIAAYHYRNDLLVAILPLMLILLVFGGNLSILVMCFGALVCYIFDLLGSMEGTIICLVITILSEVVCLVWAARVFLSQSMVNFSVVLLMWLTLLFGFLVCCNYFQSIIQEVGILLVVLDVIMFATLPLVGAALIAWFLCVEVPSLDLGLCFNVVYFLYMLHLGKPRLTITYPLRKPKGAAEAPLKRLLIPPHILGTMYVLPIAVSLAVHVALHHNVLSTAHTRVVNVLMSVLVPGLLMLYCAHNQLPIFNNEASRQLPAFTPGAADLREDIASSNALDDILPKMLDTVGFILTAAMIFCIQGHPVFDEIKSFSGLSEKAATYAIMGAVVLAFAAFATHRFVVQQSVLQEEQSDYLSSSSKGTDRCLTLLRTFVSAAVGAATALMAVVVDLPDIAIPVSVSGAVALAEYYQRKAWNGISRLALLTIATVAVWVTAICFTHNTVYYLSFSFPWHVELSMKHFCALFALLLALAVCVPTMVSVRGGGSGGLLGVEDKGAAPMGNRVFEWVFPLLCSVVAATELMVREQDWGELAGVETIYPTYYFIGTTVLVLGSAVVLYAADVVGPSCVWVLWVIQGGKLLHLLGVPSPGCLSSALVSLAYTLPFIRHVALYLRADAESDQADIRGVTPTPQMQQLSPLELLLYMALATFATFWSWSHEIPRTALAALLQRDPTDLQQLSLAISVWLAYVGCILLVFCSTASTLRSIVLVCSGVLLLIAFEGFGHLNVTIETTEESNLTLLLHPDLHIHEHPALFLILSSALTGLAWVGLIPVGQFFVSLLYSGLFAFISTKAMIGWAFPLSLASDSLTHNLASFPFIYLLCSKFLISMVGVGQGGSPLNNILLALSCLAPFIGLFYTNNTDALGGIAWSAVVGYAGLAATSRLREIYLEESGHPPSAFSPALPCAFLTIFWATLAVTQSHTLDHDIFIPLSSLVLLSTAPGAVVRDLPPLTVAGAFCASFWTISALYAILCKGYGEDPAVAAFQAQPHDIFGLDSDVSVWTNDSIWPLINLALLLPPLPGVVLGLVWKRGQEEVLFVLAVLSLVPVFAAQIGSLRYLGVLGMLLSSWRGYHLGKVQQQSDMLI